jgi:hypothetical protein
VCHAYPSSMRIVLSWSTTLTAWPRHDSDNNCNHLKNAVTLPFLPPNVLRQPCGKTIDCAKLPKRSDSCGLRTLKRLEAPPFSLSYEYENVAAAQIIKFLWNGSANHARSPIQSQCNPKGAYKPTRYVSEAIVSTDSQ